MLNHARRPEWLRQKHTDFNELIRIQKFIRNLKLNTVCDSAQCPNRTECFRQNTVTFLILGNICTRNCAFCGVEKGNPLSVDPKEPDYLVKAVEKLKLSYVVITSVTRDDLYDGGASQFAKTVETINKYDPAVVLEVLIPDFKGSASALRTVVNSSPDVLGHNIETVASLYPKVRPKANYQYSMELLKEAKRLNGSLITKSGIMLGLGETHHEVIKVMEHLREVDCDIITIGQYLRPSLNNHPVVNFVSPEDFVEYENIGKQMGFRHIVSSPMVRSSFHAMETYLLVKQYNVIRSE